MAELLTAEERAIDAVKNRNTNCTDFVVGTVVPRFLDGTLYQIAFKDQAKAGFENYAHVPNDSGDVVVYRNATYLAHGVSLHARQSSWIDRLSSTNGMSAVIAVAITATICYMTLSGKGEIKIPDVLSNALTMVLGFYFGSKSVSKVN